MQYPIGGAYDLIGKTYRKRLISERFCQTLTDAGGKHVQGPAEPLLLKFARQGAGIVTAIISVAALTFSLFQRNGAILGAAMGI